MLGMMINDDDSCNGMSVDALGCRGISVDAAECTEKSVDAVECSGMSVDAVGCRMCRVKFLAIDAVPCLLTFPML